MLDINIVSPPPHPFIPVQNMKLSVSLRLIRTRTTYITKNVVWATMIVLWSKPTTRLAASEGNIKRVGTEGKVR